MNITMDASLRLSFDRERRLWEKSLPRGPGRPIFVQPTMGGPDLGNKITYYGVEPEFISFLRTKGLPFELE
jgi:hypothetical protein